MKYKAVIASFAVFMAVVIGMPHRAFAADNGFALQVTPSPLIATIQPGKASTLELRINNTGTQKESYKMALHSFSVDVDTGKVDLKDDTPKEVSNFISFEQPTFSLEPGQWMNQRIMVDTPADAGFSYSFAIMVLRDETAATASGGAAIQGSVAVFALLNVDRKDATRKLDVVEFSSSKKVYEYLPAELSLKIKNTGNTIIAPGGNIFIARRYTDTDHIKLLPVNEAGGYIVPGSSRTLSVGWSDGFPVHTTKDGVSKLSWDISKLSQLRIGKYSAKAIVIYDDGTRDIPVEAVVSFWVFPWKLMLGALVVLVLLGTGAFSVVKKGSGVFKRKPKANE